MREFELLSRIRERLPPAGPRVLLGSGDDAAITAPGGTTATSVDALVDGVHFRRANSTPRLIGRKALSVALSDLAAMGAEPGEAYVAIGVPVDLDEGSCLELLDGLVEVAAETRTAIAGGDVTRASALSLAITVVGHAERPEQLVRRSGARPGDVIALTGEVGGAAAGLLVLDSGAAPEGVPETTLAALRARQLDPTPRIAAGRVLARGRATAMIDVSDGIAGDVRHLATQSRVGVRIDAGRLPLAAGVAEVAEAAGRDPLELAVSGGEDYELLATVPAEDFERTAAAVGQTGIALTAIGEIAGDAIEVRRPGGELVEAAGFDQLA